ncbi:MAG: enoyl-CoA hydratase/isomerase family protein [Actinomycetota bacterium]|nr:enoyl-CoA hydratase/isomerase family protein [Actinomycetota bacterium]
MDVSDGLEAITIERRGGVVDAVIDHPPINLIDRTLFRDLARLPDLVGAQPEARVLVLRSANPDFFLAHFDVELILAAPTDGPAERSSELNPFHRMCERYRTMPIPTICEIAGRVGGGGGELAASCDLRFGAAGHTALCQMEVPLGILPGGTGTQRLPALVGRGRALEIVLGGDDTDAATLERWGWLNRALATRDELRAHVARLAARIASFPPEAVSRAKASVLNAAPDPTPGLVEEAFLFQETLRTEGAQQRMRAFLERGGQTVDGERRVGALGADLG